MHPRLRSEEIASDESALALVRLESLEALLGMPPDATPEALLATATREITKLLGDRGSCLLLDGGARVALAPHAPSAVGRPVDLERYPEVVAAAADCAPVVIEDARADRRLAAVRPFLPLTLGAVAAVPLAVGGSCLGVFLVQSTEARHLGPEAVATSALLARLTASLLVRGQSRLGGIAALPARAPGAIAAEASAMTPRRLLVIEDDRQIASVLCEALEHEGYVIDLAGDGPTGLARALASRPDLVLLDVNMPRMDGFEVAVALRGARGTADVPIIFLSGAANLPVRVRRARIDDVDFIPKPYSLHELLARIDRALAAAQARRKLRLSADHDELTGLGNLRLFRARMTEERARFTRYGHPFSLLMIDVDKLKGINDRHGHLVGSEVLSAIAGVLRREARETDLAVRYGGDEYVVLMPETRSAEAVALAERVLQAVRRLRPSGIEVSVSIGVASLAPEEALESGDQLLQRADAAAYRAKRDGGDQIQLEATDGADRS